MGRGFFVVSRRKKQFTVSFTAIFKEDNFVTIQEHLTESSLTSSSI